MFLQVIPSEFNFLPRILPLIPETRNMSWDPDLHLFLLGYIQKLDRAHGLLSETFRHRQMS